MLRLSAPIRCTSSRKVVDAKARSKWARALIFAAEYKLPSEPLEHFIRRHGGINLCTAELDFLACPENDQHCLGMNCANYVVGFGGEEAE
jgi:hypothetical protein